MAWCRNKATGSSGPGRCSIWQRPLEEVAISPIKELPGWRSTNWRKIIPKKFSHCCEVSRPQNRLPNLGIQQRDWEFPQNLTLKVSRIWLQNFHRTGEKETLGRTNKTLCALQPRRKEQWPHQELDLPGSGSLQQRHRSIVHGSRSGSLAGAFLGDMVCWHKSSWRRSPLGLAQRLQSFHRDYVLQKWAALGKTTWRKHRPTHQQKIGLNICWGWPCPPEQDPVFPTASPSHQELVQPLIYNHYRADEMKNTITEN